MDGAFTGAVPHLRDGTGSQVIRLCTGQLARARIRVDEMAKQNHTTTQRSTRKTLTIAVLVLVALGFYVASFFVVSG